jgi:hypothetical protein
VELPAPAPIRSLANEIEAGVRAARSLPDLAVAVQQLSNLTPAVEQIASFGTTLAEIQRAVPALEQLATLGGTLDDLARVAPALERLADLGTTLEALLETLRPLGELASLAPTLQSLDASISRLEGALVTVSDTLAPLQSTTQRVGKVVDRLGSGKRGKSAAPSEEAGTDEASR